MRRCSLLRSRISSLSTVFIATVTSDPCTLTRSTSPTSPLPSCCTRLKCFSWIVPELCWTLLSASQARSMLPCGFTRSSLAGITANGSFPAAGRAPSICATAS